MACSNKKRDLLKARIFSNIFTFIDGLCTFNNNEFENNFNDIHPRELQLKKEKKDPCKASFLDLSTKVHDRKFTTELFVKRCLFLIPYQRKVRRGKVTKFWLGYESFLQRVFLPDEYFYPTNINK